MQDPNYNTFLGISLDDIEKETNLTTLYNWEDKLLKKSQDLKARIKNKRLQLSSPISIQDRNEILIMEDLQSNIKSFRRNVHNRIKRVKSLKNFNRNVYFNMLKIFKELVKEKLSSEEYEEIRAEAYKRAEELVDEEEITKP